MCACHESPNAGLGGFRDRFRVRVFRKGVYIRSIAGLKAYCDDLFALAVLFKVHGPRSWQLCAQSVLDRLTNKHINGSFVK